MGMRVGFLLILFNFYQLIFAYKNDIEIKYDITQNVVIISGQGIIQMNDEMKKKINKSTEMKIEGEISEILGGGTT